MSGNPDYTYMVIQLGVPSPLSISIICVASCSFSLSFTRNCFDGHVFSVGGGVATSGWGGGVYTPPNSQKFRLRRAKKKKKVAGFSENFFTTWKKLPYPPQPVLAGGMKVLGGGIYPPIPPHAHYRNLRIQPYPFVPTAPKVNTGFFPHASRNCGKNLQGGLKKGNTKLLRIAQEPLDQIA